MAAADSAARAAEARDAALATAMDANAALLGLRIPADSRASVLMYFKLAAQMAELVHGLPLSPADESGNVFRPVPPEVGE